MGEANPIIISGTYRGRRLKVPSGDEIMRPTLTRCKKSLFDRLAAQFPPAERQNMVFADIFAGCGSVGLEALSIGIATIYFIENHPESLRFLHSNIAALAVEPSVRVINANAFQPPQAEKPADIVFFDPPYDIEPEAWQALLEAYHKQGWITPESLIIAQHALATPPQISPPYNITDSRPCGKTAMSYIRYG